MKKDIMYYEKLWFIVSVPVLVCIVLLYKLDSIKVCNILQIEFSKDYDVFNGLIAGHSNAVLSNNHYFDFVFIICYSLLFVVSLQLIFKSLDFNLKKRWFLTCLIPGILDCIENVLFLGLLDGDGASNKFDAYYWIVRLKWGVLVIYIQALLAILVFYLLLYFYKFIYWLKALISN